MCRVQTQASLGRLWGWRTQYNTVLNVFVEIIKEPYISAADPQGLLLPADLPVGRWVMKQASLETVPYPRSSHPPLIFCHRVLFFFSVLVCWTCCSTSALNAAYMNGTLVRLRS